MLSSQLIEPGLAVATEIRLRQLKVRQARSWIKSLSTFGTGWRSRATSSWGRAAGVIYCASICSRAKKNCSRPRTRPLCRCHSEPLSEVSLQGCGANRAYVLRW